MGTFLSLHIQSSDKAQVLQLLQQLSGINNISTGPYPKELDDNMLIGEHVIPTFMAIAEPQNGWINVQLNSYGKIKPWLEKISKQLDTRVIHILAQTVSDSYYFLVYENGKWRREIDLFRDDIQNGLDLGEKYSFERIPVIPVTEEDYENIFNIYSIEAYCKEFGFAPFDDIENNSYHIIRGKNTAPSVEDIIASMNPANKTPGKPWWKFW